jgi:cellulose synthase (UDP-forming)
MSSQDARLRPPAWNAAAPTARRRRAIRLLLLAVAPLALFYFAWLLRPDRVGHPALYGLLVAAELFNFAQALGFWWTCAGERRRRRPTWDGPPPAVDVFVPVYDEPVPVVEPTVRAAAALTGARVRVHVLDDGASDAMAAMAARHDAGYLRRERRDGA